MKKLARLIVVSICWLTAANASAEEITLGGSKCAEHVAGGCSLTVQTVLADPERYRGKLIGVSGYVLGGWEGVTLFSDQKECLQLVSPEPVSKEGDWAPTFGLVSFGIALEHQDFKKWPCAEVDIEGVFLPQDPIQEEPGVLTICIWCKDGYLDDISFLRFR